VGLSAPNGTHISKSDTKRVLNKCISKENTDMLLGDAKATVEKRAAGVKAHYGK
jgi:hypothetical protein